MKHRNDMNIENGAIVADNNDGKSWFEDDPVYYCGLCGQPIYEGDVIYNIFGERLCEECINYSRDYAL